MRRNTNRRGGRGWRWGWLGLLPLLVLVPLVAEGQAPSPPPQQCVTTAIASGTADALVVPKLPCTPTASLLILQTPLANLTTTPTIQAVGDAALVVVNQAGAPLQVGDFQPGQWNMFLDDGTNWVKLAPTIVTISGTGYLMQNLTFYVRTDGNDTACTGQTDAAYVSGSYPQNCAFATWQTAANAYLPFNFNGHDVTLKGGNQGVAETWNLTTPIVLNTIVGYGQLFIEPSPSGTTINGKGGAFNLIDTLRPVNFGPLTLTSNTSGYGTITIFGKSTAQMDTVAGGPTFGTAFFADLWCHDGQAQALWDNASYSITGSKNYHIFVNNGCTFFYEGDTVTIANPITVSSFVAANKAGQIQSTGTTFVNPGNVTGNKWNATANGVVDTEGNDTPTSDTYFPGSTPGLASGGGLYQDHVAAQVGVQICDSFFGCTWQPTLASVSSFSVVPQGRLSLTQFVPVLNGSVSGAGTVYYNEYEGQLVPLWDGQRQVVWQMNVDGISNILANSAVGHAGPAAVVANSNYDLFVWLDPATNLCCLLTRGPAWTNNTTRSLALGRLGGILNNQSAITNGPDQFKGTYVGTIHTNAGGTVDYIFGVPGSSGGAASFGVWNMYHRVRTVTSVTDTQAAYAYTGGVREAGGGAGNQVSFLVGSIEDGITANYMDQTEVLGVVGAQTKTGIGFDSTTAFKCQPRVNTSVSGAAVQVTSGASVCALSLSDVNLGFHTIAGLEQGDGANGNLFDDGSSNTLSVSIRN